MLPTSSVKFQRLRQALADYGPEWQEQQRRVKLCVMVGTIFGVKTFHGPFEDIDHLNQWLALRGGNQRYEVFEMECVD